MNDFIESVLETEGKIFGTTPWGVFWKNIKTNGLARSVAKDYHSIGLSFSETKANQDGIDIWLRILSALQVDYLKRYSTSIVKPSQAEMPYWVSLNFEPYRHDHGK